MKQALIAFVAFCVLVLIFAVGYWLNLPGMHTFLGAANDALTEVFGALFVGLKILFFAGLGLGIAWCVIELRRHSEVKVIGPGRHGMKQAIIHNGQVVHLQQPNQAQLDPLQQMALLQKFIQVQPHLAKYAQPTTVQEVKPLEIEAPAEQIGAIVKYADVVAEVPEGMSLLGIHPASGHLEFADYEKLKMLWIVGSSSTGKSNTIYGKALEARNSGALLAVVDQHINKPDSLAKKLAPLADAYIRPVAVSDDQVIDTLHWFKTEFEARVDDTTGERSEQKIVLIMDEINRMDRNEALRKLIKEVVLIGGEESRGFGMYVWVITQKAVNLKWLRDSAITVIAHRVTSFAEALLACNQDRKAAQRLLTFPVGRSFIYGVDFEGLIELQQPLYEVDQESVVESTIEAVDSPDTEKVQSISSSDGRHTTPVVEPVDRSLPFDLEKFRQAQKMLLARETQNKIICTVWNVQENSRQFRAAKEEFQMMLAYLASMASVEEA